MHLIWESSRNSWHRFLFKGKREPLFLSTEANRQQFSVLVADTHIRNVSRLLNSEFLVAFQHPHGLTNSVHCFHKGLDHAGWSTSGWQQEKSCPPQEGKRVKDCWCESERQADTRTRRRYVHLVPKCLALVGLWYKETWNNARNLAAFSRAV